MYKYVPMNHQVYGMCLLRPFSGYFEYSQYQIIGDALVHEGIVPKAFEFHDFPYLTNDQVLEYLQAMGYSADAVIQTTGMYQTISSLGLVQYVGKPLTLAVDAVKGNTGAVKFILLGLASTIGTLHKYGIIAGDTHEYQFTVDEDLSVWRIDTGNSFYVSTILIEFQT